MNHAKSEHWVARHSRPTIFLILTLALLGGIVKARYPPSSASVRIRKIIGRECLATQ